MKLILIHNVYRIFYPGFSISFSQPRLSVFEIIAPTHESQSTPVTPTKNFNRGHTFTFFLKIILEFFIQGFKSVISH